MPEKAWHPWTGNPRLAHCFLVGMQELNALFPNRAQGPQEGTIGDVAHQAEAGGSDHDPNGQGVVRAWDIDVTGHDFNAQQLANYLALMMRNHHPMFGTRGYVIFNRHITPWSPWATPWMPYSGPDPHDRHIHVSVGTQQSEYDSTIPWGLSKAFSQKPSPVPNVPLIGKADEKVVIITPGNTPLPYLITGGRAVQITSGTTWHNYAAAGIPTIQVDPVDYHRTIKELAA